MWSTVIVLFVIIIYFIIFLEKTGTLWVVFSNLCIVVETDLVTHEPYRR